MTNREIKRIQERIAKEADQMFRLLINRYFNSFMVGEDLEKETIAKWNMFCKNKQLTEQSRAVMKNEIDKIKEEYKKELQA